MIKESSMTLQRVSSLWKESVSFFALENLRLFFLGTLNNAYRTLTIGMSYFWWLFLIVIGARMVGAEWIENVALLLVYFFLVMIARPSVERKDSNYFFMYLYKFPGYLGLCFMFYSWWFIFNIIFASYCSPFLFSDAPCSGLMLFCSVLIPRLTMLSLLFFMDMTSTLKNMFVAAWNSLKFCWYFLPVMIVVIFVEVFLLSVPQILGFFITWQVHNSHFLKIVSLLLVGLVRLFALSMVTMYYTKAKYQHHRLFFK